MVLNLHICFALFFNYILYHMNEEIKLLTMLLISILCAVQYTGCTEKINTSIIYLLSPVYHPHSPAICQVCRILVFTFKFTDVEVGQTVVHVAGQTLVWADGQLVHQLGHKVRRPANDKCLVKTHTST